MSVRSFVQTIFGVAFIICWFTNIAFAVTAEQKAQLDRELSAVVGDGYSQVPGLGVIVLQGGKEVYSNFFGNAVIDGQNPANNKPMTRNTLFRIASVSKSFTMFTIMQLVEQGKIDLDTDVSDYLGFKLRNPNYPDTPITVRMVASHLSSLRNGSYYALPPHKNIREFFVPDGTDYNGGEHFAPLGQEPGKYFCYCDLNYNLLGTVIERVTGERFDLYQKNHILRQLDIKGDYVVSNLGREEFANLGTVYRKKNADGVLDEHGSWYANADARGKQPPKNSLHILNKTQTAFEFYHIDDYAIGTNASIFSPTGGLRISLEDLTHALIMLMNNGTYRGQQVLFPESVTAMTGRVWQYDPQTENGDNYGGSITSYGLGLYQFDGNGTSRLCKDAAMDFVGHTGVAYGLLSMMCFRPGTKDGFVYVMNGLPIDENTDERSFGKFSGNYIWEEKVADPICRIVFNGNLGTVHQ